MGNQDAGTAAGCVTLTAPSPPPGRQVEAAHAHLFANPNLPQIDDYYEPFTFDYDHLQSAPKARPRPPRARAA